MSEPGHELIIVRRHDEEEHEHHSSAWKVAHADFMTAMMAFFLIMWLINVTDDEVQKGISQYFNPIHMSQGSSDLKGLNKPGTSEKDAGRAKGHNDVPLPGSALNLLKLSAGHPDAAAVSEAEAAAAIRAAAEVAEKLGEQIGGEADGAKGGPDADGEAAAGAPGDRAAFADPYAVLARLAEQYAARQGTSPYPVAGDIRPPGAHGGVLERDPFDPAYWQTAPLPPARAEAAGSAALRDPVPAGVKPDAAALAALAADEPAVADGLAAPRPQSVALPPVGEEPAVAETPASLPEAPAGDRATAGSAPSASADAVALSQSVAGAIDRQVREMMAAEASPTLSVAATHEGVVINLTDDAGYAMFGVGSAMPDAKTVVLLEKIARVLAERPGAIVLRGFTDGRPFHSANYDNWRLSAARAHMAYHMLVRGGLDEARVQAIEGHADRNLKNPGDSYAAENRRIEILLKEPAE